MSFPDSLGAADVPPDEVLEAQAEADEEKQVSESDEVASSVADIDMTSKEANAADVLEQHREVPVDEDYPHE
ncbi:hypothetical protein [Rhodococcus sp. HNM0569]|uniref:hypothetical protein n=1 Tax=Rhodococcus sp. HNM0569 TaxID=2716340 RepID=UPI00146F8DC6|nr:hypothetical protein [Rhodococcus sp. HNM0569]NLU83850.1 hypothetical protein [Rhodococcus sp. HNM0569]